MKQADVIYFLLSACHRSNSNHSFFIQPPGIKSCDLNICESDAQLVAHISDASQLVPVSRRCVALRPPPLPPLLSQLVESIPS